MAMRTATPWWASLTFGIGLLFFMLGERLFGHTSGARFVMTGLGLLAMVGVAGLRVLAMQSSSGARRKVERTLAISHAGTLAGLALYALTTDWGTGKLGLSDAAATHFRGAGTVLFLALIVASIVPLLMVELSLGTALRTDLELRPEAGDDAALAPRCRDLERPTAYTPVRGGAEAETATEGHDAPVSGVPIRGSEHDLTNCRGREIGERRQLGIELRIELQFQLRPAHGQQPARSGPFTVARPDGFTERSPRSGLLTASDQEVPDGRRASAPRSPRLRSSTSTAFVVEYPSPRCSGAEHLVGARGEYDYRCTRPAAKLAQKIDAVAIG